MAKDQENGTSTKGPEFGYSVTRLEKLPQGTLLLEKCCGKMLPMSAKSAYLRFSVRKLTKGRTEEV